MHRRARFCRVCGQAFKGAPWDNVCPGCKSKGENMTEHDMWLTTPPETVDARTCGECANCIIGIFGCTVCEKRLLDDPGVFSNWRDAFDYIETRAVVDVCDAACDEFEEE